MICQITLVTAARVSGQIRSEDRCGEPRKEGGKRKRNNISKKKDAEKHSKKTINCGEPRKKNRYNKNQNEKKKNLGLHVNTRIKKNKKNKQQKQNTDR